MANMMVVDGDQLARLMKLCRTIQSGGAGTVDQLTVKLKTSRRTVFRDISTLNEIGIKVSLTDKGYRVKQNAAACRKALRDREQKSFDRVINAALK